MNTFTASPAFRSRSVERTVRGQPTSDGAGVRLTRVLTQPLQRRLDPFLMLDAFGSDSADDYVGGFPDHPHRGFETVTIMLEGRMRHRDSVGNVGLLEPGSVQWMTAGRGIIHSEMPEQEAGRMAGFQLWVNLAAADKMQPPAYRDIAPAGVPVRTAEHGVQVRVIAGASGEVRGAVERPTTEPIVLDIALPAGQAFEAAIPAGHNAFAYVYAGAVDIGDAGAATRVEVERLAILGNEAQAERRASRGAGRRGAGARPPRRRPAARRADRPARAVRHEHDRRAAARGERLPARRAGDLSGRGGADRAAWREAPRRWYGRRQSAPPNADMPRTILEEARLHPAIRERVATLNADIVHNVQAAASSNAVLVVGMAGNPVVRRVRKALAAAAIALPLPRVRQLLQRMAAAQRAEDVDRLADLSDGLRQGRPGRRRQARRRR